MTAWFGSQWRGAGPLLPDYPQTILCAAPLALKHFFPLSLSTLGRVFVPAPGSAWVAAPAQYRNVM